MGQTVNVRLELGRRLIPSAGAHDLSAGGMVALDRNVDDPVDVYVAGRLYARGQAVVVDGKLAVRIEEIVASDARRME
ncbi:MAG: FliM/FliN family flagellar motor switch protein [Phycisphaerae bacterium]|nr:FliM/FliN family flagellar motor switch protein [Phycisphaerae bacterium]